MTKRDDRINLLDMLDHAREAGNIVGNCSRQEFSQDRVRQLALARLLEIIGEAANRITQEARVKYSNIPWPQIIGMRNRLIHAYDVIDYDLVWDTIESDLPPLVSELERILEEE